MTFAISCSLQIKLIQDSEICPNLKFVNTTHHLLKPQRFRMKPDISILSAIDRNDPQPASGRLRWRAVDLWIENKKTEEHDVFRKLDRIKDQETVEASSE